LAQHLAQVNITEIPIWFLQRRNDRLLKEVTASGQEFADI
jgi:hypothetical protein